MSVDIAHVSWCVCDGAGGTFWANFQCVFASCNEYTVNASENYLFIYEIN